MAQGDWLLQIRENSSGKSIRLSCLAGECSPTVARVAFVEAAREANIYVPPAEIDPVTAGRPAPKWRYKKPRRRA